MFYRETILLRLDGSGFFRKTGESNGRHRRFDCVRLLIQQQAASVKRKLSFILSSAFLRYILSPPDRIDKDTDLPEKTPRRDRIPAALPPGSRRTFITEGDKRK